MNALEIFGYVAMLIVAVSFLMKDVLKLRITNAVGDVMFVIYGLMTNTIPVALLNALVTGINVYYIIKILKERKEAK
ncbi:YgjV family protein [Kingella negevensis]|uniref:YgjV family protein n=1 Tax=Kingella negevensis TaxID=1522312 RepID=UPI00050A29D0|nr:YgjV family protein [Kingella negevensis]MDK4688113.1 YgjV family protein [Kingella negevensis]WII90902.1 YgjV family protein [Kingella negevensis]WII92338.1 YgjV family protein [Kingella negevensis]